MAFLVALLLAFGQLSENGELIALRASGFSFVEITWPFLGVSLLLSGLLFYLNHKASPEGFYSFRNQYARAAQQIARVDLEPRSFLRLGSWKLFAREVNRDTGLLDGVYLLRQQSSQAGFRVNASRGRLGVVKGDGASLELEDGEIQFPNPDPEKFTTGRFKRYRIEVPLAGGLRLERSPDMQEMSSRRLRGLIADPKTMPQRRTEYQVELSLRSAGALSCIVFFWIAAPLGLQMGRHSRVAGFAVSLVVLFAFYGLLVLGVALGRRQESLSTLGPWLADAAGMILGLSMTRRALSR
jgi:lipopolysaccharide export LptBFGC system permease protein LptF